MNIGGILGIVQLGLQIAPSIVQSVETLFGKRPKPANPEEKQQQSAAKAQAALNMAEAGIVAALGLAPGAFGEPEKALVRAIHSDVVSYFNAKGWPVT